MNIHGKSSKCQNHSPSIKGYVPATQEESTVYRGLNADAYAHLTEEVAHSLGDENIDKFNRINSGSDCSDEALKQTVCTTRLVGAGEDQPLLLGYYQIDDQCNWEGKGTNRQIPPCKPVVSD